MAVMDDVPALQKLIPQSARELSKGYYTPQQIESAITYIFDWEEFTFSYMVLGRVLLACEAASWR
jgi:hypothetical protein